MTDREGSPPDLHATTSKLQLPVIEELNLYVNSKIAKIIATGVVIVFITYHGFLHAVDGGDSWSAGVAAVWVHAAHILQHRLSALHAYVAFLKQQNHMLFVGDSRIRQMFLAMVKQIAVTHPKLPESPHEDLHYNDTNLHLNIDFYWRPNIDEEFAKIIGHLKRKSPLPKLIVMGSATHSIKNHNGSAAALDAYKKNITAISSALDQIGNRTRLLWMLQDPVVPERLKPHQCAITNDQLDLYNMAAMEVLYDTKVRIWSSSRLVAQGSIGGFTDGIHAGEVAVKYDTQILMNLYCNDHLNFNDGTCCNSREAVTMTQIATFAALCFCPIIMIAVAVKQWFCVSNHMGGGGGGGAGGGGGGGGGGTLPAAPSSLPSAECSQHRHKAASVDMRGDLHSSYREFLFALGKLGLIMGYFFLCDRTSLFMKENKYFSHLNFWLPLGYVFALGLFFTEDTSHTRLLHRDMTDEWKGWMQLVILIYHMTGASQVLPVYMHVRVLVSSYLFLTGYGHFSYYWTGRDMGIVRYCQVMFRINFVVVILCLVMNRPYQFYYFVPLVSFWYTVMHVTLVLPPRITRPAHANSEASPFNYLYSIIKFIGLGGFITVLFLSEVFFEKIFVMRPWKALFVTTDDDIHEWWFRWQLDRYSLLYGMMFSLVYNGLTQYSLINDQSNSNILSGRLALLVSFAATVFIASYTTMTVICTNKPDCNEIHPYVVWVPITGFIVLRNMLFVCQYHVWLAADTHGVLVLIPSYPVANVLVTSFIFICICHELHHITDVLTPFLVPNDSLRAVRNLSVFLFLLMAIGVHDGVF
ncbi:hypothetical protein O3P69_005223 [Scylla paramamosain]|uniref:Cas1p 10 TM acyl transferase domain-containing protein n=1 Tax=Scylla paramamosain TaxID=85552 RepID=A0AAW0U9E8_SCYPA